MSLDLRLFFAFAILYVAGSVTSLTVIQPSSTHAWNAGQLNVLQWTNATWNTTFYNRSLGSPFNVSIEGTAPGHIGSTNLGTFNGTDGEALIDMRKWKESAAAFELVFSYYAETRPNQPVRVVFGQSDLFAVNVQLASTTSAPSATTTAKLTAIGLNDGDSSNGSVSLVTYWSITMLLYLSSVIIAAACLF